MQTLSPVRIQSYLNTLAARGHVLGARVGGRTCVDGVWLTDQQLAAQAGAETVFIPEQVETRPAVVLGIVVQVAK